MDILGGIFGECLDSLGVILGGIHGRTFGEVWLDLGGKTAIESEMKKHLTKSIETYKFPVYSLAGNVFAPPTGGV